MSLRTAVADTRLIASLLTTAETLATRAEQLNARRKEVFGGSELALVATERVRTENNCLPRDIVAIGATDKE